MDLKRRIPALTFGSVVLAATALTGATAVVAQDDMDAEGPVYRFTITNNAAGAPWSFITNPTSRAPMSWPDRALKFNSPNPETI